jgi:hypothetical protein
MRAAVVPFVMFALPWAWDAGGLVGVARAQVLHERVRLERASAGRLRCEGGACWSTAGTAGPGATGGLPRAIVDSDGALHFAPELGRGSATPQSGEQIFSPQPDQPVVVGGPGASGGPGDRKNEIPERRDVVRSDRETGPEPPGTRYYHMVFDPEPFPYKRMTALDDVVLLERPCPDGRPGLCEEEALAVRDRTRRLEPIRGAAGRGCGGKGQPACGELFWGSIVVDFEPDRWVPIPSVAAESRVLEARLEPAAPVELSVDGAGNMFARSTAGGRRRMVWLVEASARYFGGELPRGITLADVPSVMVHAPPAKVRARAETVLKRIGLRPRPSMSYAAALDALVGYFRAFEIGELPPAAMGSGSTYLDIALGQKGVCRHRSYAFTITALAAGIPARYVENEVHVFVEVWVPRAGWRRINLGGAPLDEALVGAQGKSVYEERGVDPFSKPEAFTRATGAPPKGVEQLAPRERNGVGAGSSGSSSSGSSGTGSGPAAGARGERPIRGVPDREGKVDLAALAEADEARMARAAEGKIAARVATQVRVELGARDAFRGERVEIRGAVEPAAVAGALPIELYLEGAQGAVKIADVVTDEAGRFRAVVEVPPTVAVGPQRLIARTPGDERRLPSSSSR